MDKVNSKMVRAAKSEFNSYCKKYGDSGKVQVELENRYNELKKAYDARKSEILNRFKSEKVVKFYESDEWCSFAAFNLLFIKVWELVAEVVIAYEDNDASSLNKAIRNAASEERINIGKLLLNLH